MWGRPAIGTVANPFERQVGSFARRHHGHHAHMRRVLYMDLHAWSCQAACGIKAAFHERRAVTCVFLTTCSPFFAYGGGAPWRFLLTSGAYRAGPRPRCHHHVPTTPTGTAPLHCFSILFNMPLYLALSRCMVYVGGGCGGRLGRAVYVVVALQAGASVARRAAVIAGLQVWAHSAVGAVLGALPTIVSGLSPSCAHTLLRSPASVCCAPGLSG
jgi:hypothetical protein